ncbi:hypothetical protein RHS04_04903 [Rhizoctonia solani]|uniref:Uncharacterized protein n=1 Tax=Rhizoctonia solani TaxID=456999 RepID=A0A8H7LJX2_9AGAM|nr:hypothetical protein RHS04_04903 [Rhizoctonia solani]
MPEPYWPVPAGVSGMDPEVNRRRAPGPRLRIHRRSRPNLPIGSIENAFDQGLIPLRLGGSVCSECWRICICTSRTRPRPVLSPRSVGIYLAWFEGLETYPFTHRSKALQTPTRLVLPLLLLLLATSTAGIMSASHFAPHTSAPHHYPPLSGKPLSGLSYIRRSFFVPEVAPLLGVVSFAVGMGIYFGSGAARKSDVQWHSHQPWLRNPADSTHWEGRGGVREMLLSAGKQEYVDARDKMLHMRN